MTRKRLGINFSPIGPRRVAVQGQVDWKKVVAYDSFTDTNGVALTSHKPDFAPGGWVADRGTSDIQSNKASWLTNGIIANNVQTIDIGLSDVTISTIVQMNSANPAIGIAFRAIDADNVFIATINVNIFFVLRTLAGVDELLDFKVFTLSQSVNYLIEVKLEGSLIVATVDGGHEISLNDSNFQTATKHGLHSQDPATCDEFKVIG